MDKRETVVESIQKLLNLSVSDQEIADNLSDVGIEKAEAMELIKTAKANTAKQKQGDISATAPDSNSSKKNQVPEQKKYGDYFEPASANLSMDEQIVKQIPLTKNIDLKKDLVDQNANKNSIGDAKNIVDDVEGQEEAIEEEVDSATSPMDTNELNESDEYIDKDLEALEKSVGGNSSKNKNENDSPKKIVPVVPENPSSLVKEKPSEIISKKTFSRVPNMNFTDSVPFVQNSNKSIDLSPGFEELWKKGIVVAVNAKLSEMKKLKDDVDSQVRDKVDEAVRKELYQFKILLDSQKDLMISSNKEALEQKQKEIVFIIDSKIAELRQYNKQLSDNLSAIETAKAQQAIALSQVNQALDEAKKTKVQLIVEMNSELIKTKSQAQAFLDSSTAHLNQMDERINKTLELEKNIAEGMLAQAEQKIEQLAIARADELISNMEVELNRLQSISKKISPEMLDQKISVLEEFKKQFLTSMQQNLTQINSAIDELNQRNIAAERTLAEKSLAIDAKIEELTKFEKEFTEKFMKKIK
ncbi:MAG: hypothetical protein WCW13_00175 [archaeon]|jgi:hypothetical protein